MKPACLSVYAGGFRIAGPYVKPVSLSVYADGFDMGGGGVNVQSEIGLKALHLLPPLQPTDHDDANVTLVVVGLAVRRFAQWQSSGSSIGNEAVASEQCVRFDSSLSNSHD